MRPTEGSLTEGELREACLHAIGDGTSYRCTGSLSNDSLITQGVALARRASVDADVARDAARSPEIDLLVGAKGIPAAREDLADARRAVHEASRRGNSTLWMLTSEMLTLAKVIGTSNGDLVGAESRRAACDVNLTFAEAELLATNMLSAADSTDEVRLPDVYVPAIGEDGVPVPGVELHPYIQGLRIAPDVPQMSKSCWTYTDVNGKTHHIARMAARTFLGPCPEGSGIIYVNGTHWCHVVPNMYYEPKSEVVSHVLVDGKQIVAFDLTPNAKGRIKGPSITAVYGALYMHLKGLPPDQTPTSRQDRNTKCRNLSDEHACTIEIVQVDSTGKPANRLRFDHGVASRIKNRASEVLIAIAAATSRFTRAQEAVAQAEAHHEKVRRTVHAARAEWDALLVRLRLHSPDKATIVDMYPDDPRSAIDALLDGYNLISLTDAVKNERLAQNILADAVRRNAELTDLILFIDPSERESDQMTVQAAIQGLLAEKLIVRGKKHGWHLTGPDPKYPANHPANQNTGLQAAVAVRAKFSKVNTTANWFHHAVGQQWLAGLRFHLANVFKRSAQVGEIDDLINNFVVKKIANDGFRKRIAEGKPLSMADIKAWTKNSSCSQFRDEGRDAQTRQVKGARTERDLREESGEVYIPGPAEGNKIITLCEDGDGSPGMLVGSGASGDALIDVVGGDMEQEMLDAISYKEGMDDLEGILTSGSEERTFRMLRMCAMEGKTYEQIAAVEQIPRSRVSTLLRTKVQSINTDRDATRTEAARILQYLTDEPFSTYEDLIEELGADVPMEALDRLVDVQCLHENDDGCYTVTKRGESTLSQFSTT